MTRRRDEPMCDHERHGIVTSGGEGQPHAATNVCYRDECIADAIAWATSITRLPAEHRVDPGKAVQEALW